MTNNITTAITDDNNRAENAVVLRETEELVVFGIGEVVRSQCNDVFRCGYSLYKRDECRSVFDRTVPVSCWNCSVALVK